MTKDLVLKRKSELSAQRDQLIANINSVVGALQDCEYWLTQFEVNPDSGHAAVVQSEEQLACTQ